MKRLFLEHFVMELNSACSAASSVSS